MTITELARLLGSHIAQGRGHYELAVFQWQHGYELVTELVPREGAEVLELYSGTRPVIAPPGDDEDLLGFPAADEPDDLDDLI